jgi:hypothetical protein
VAWAIPELTQIIPIDEINVPITNVRH